MTKSYTVFNLETGEAVREGFCLDEDLALQESFGNIVVSDLLGINRYYYKNGIKAYTSEELQIKTNRPSLSHVWSNQTMGWTDTRSTEQIKEEAWLKVKAQRDQLLQESDWRVIKAMDTGIPLSETWKLYRQALRDITTQSDPNNIMWPKPPTT